MGCSTSEYVLAKVTPSVHTKNQTLCRTNKQTAQTSTQAKPYIICFVLLFRLQFLRRLPYFKLLQINSTIQRRILMEHFVMEASQNDQFRKFMEQRCFELVVDGVHHPGVTRNCNWFSVGKLERWIIAGLPEKCGK